MLCCHPGSYKTVRNGLVSLFDNTLVSTSTVELPFKKLQNGHEHESDPVTWPRDKE